MKNLNLKKYGLTPEVKRESSLHSGLFLARVCERQHNMYKVVSQKAEMIAKVSSKMISRIKSKDEFPVVGDWVLIDREDNMFGFAAINHVLNRKNALMQNTLGEADGLQMLAVNMDYVFVCMALDEKFNLCRLERHLDSAKKSGAIPVIVLTKSDLCKDLELKFKQVHSISDGADVVACSSALDDYIGIYPYLSFGETIVFIGDSGVGKKTLISRLLLNNVLGSQMKVKRQISQPLQQLMVLPSGAIVIDTPGAQEMQFESSQSYEEIKRTTSFLEGCSVRDGLYICRPNCKAENANDEKIVPMRRSNDFNKQPKDKTEKRSSNINIFMQRRDRTIGMLESGMKCAYEHVLAEE